MTFADVVYGCWALAAVAVAALWALSYRGAPRRWIARPSVLITGLIQRPAVRVVVVLGWVWVGVHFFAR